jgi:RNA recognition motif-containing protein
VEEAIGELRSAVRLTAPDFVILGGELTKDGGRAALEQHPGEVNREGEGNEGEKKAEETTSLLVRNVPYGTRPDDLRELFSKYGEIKDIYIPMVRINARPTFSYLQLILR